MLFNSIEFLLFLPIVFLLYWFVCNKNLGIQNFFVVVASYVFYAWWDWRFLSLIVISTSVDFIVGMGLAKQDEAGKRKLLLGLSLLVNLGLLAFFKYYNFFVDSFIDAFNLFGLHLDQRTLNIILPVGISFYTFQTLSYSIDVYRRQMEPTKNLLAFAAYVSFFPQLVAGPIERAKDLLPQFFETRDFSYAQATDGMRQILLGFFKKIVIADACAPYVNQIFENYAGLTGSTLLVGGVLFVVQVYCDFAGYSDIAIGTARLFGFNLTKNFDVPYVSTSTTEMWRRWHITLGNWASSYIFNPLGFGQVKKFGPKGMYIAFIVTFLLIGLWHGAAYTFIVFGLIHGVVLSLELASKKPRKKVKAKIGPGLHAILGWGITMTIWLLTCIIFRSTSMHHAFGYFGNLFSASLFSIPTVHPVPLLLLIFLLLSSEYFHRNKEHTMDIKSWPKGLRWATYLTIVFCILSFGEFSKDQFIYFQF